ncbi:threonine/serine dehydratase [Sphaerisporangium sp. NPDC051011]|uniref:threonine ammonia-lyase n=1 Tax=Sphaerisporangium sp. NPDC051011 TaxID=3155792 RepID=UPI0033FBA21A
MIAATTGVNSAPGPHIDAALVDAAERYLADLVLRSPCEYSPALSDRLRRRIWLKWELMQPTRSFKVRGALNKMRHLAETNDGPLRVATASTGNHGLALSYAARIHGAIPVVFAPPGANPAKMQAIREMGGEIRTVGTDWQTAYAVALSASAEEGMSYVHSFDDPYIIAGQATVGTEIAAQVPDVAAVLVPIGGGGLISGVATGLRLRGSAAQVIGVQPDGADSMGQSLAAGKPIMIPPYTTVADGLGSRQPGDLTFAITQALVREVVAVPDTATVDAMRWVLSAERFLVEPSSAITVAALADPGLDLPDGDVVCVMSGGNVDPALLAAVLGEHRPPTPSGKE